MSGYTLKKNSTVAAAGTTTGPISLEGNHSCFGFYTPTGLTSNTMFVEVSEDGTNWFPVQKDGADYAIAVVGGKFYPLDYALLVGAAFFRLRFTALTSARVFTFKTGPVL